MSEVSIYDVFEFFFWTEFEVLSFFVYPFDLIDLADESESHLTSVNGFVVK